MAIKLLIGGSPCTHWSIAQRNRETTAEGLGWELFRNYLIAKDKFNPDFFLYENNVSATKAIKEMIAETLGVGSEVNTRFTEIDSSLVSAQRRKRFYVTNLGEIKQPNDRNISLESILQSGTVDRQKSLCLTRRYAGFEGSQSYLRRRYFGKSMGQAVFENTTAEQQKEIWKQDPYQEVETKGSIRALTPIECERLQTLPDDYTKAVSERWRKECIGNGWTAEVIIHLLNHALSDVPRDEEIIVLSLSMTELRQADIVWIRWVLPMLPIMRMRLINTLSRSLWITTRTLFNAETLSLFVKKIGNLHKLVQSGLTAC